MVKHGFDQPLRRRRAGRGFVGRPHASRRGRPVRGPGAPRCLAEGAMFLCGLGQSSASVRAEAAALVRTEAGHVDGSSHGISHEDERALVARAQAGDTAAFREMYERYAGSVHRYAIPPLVHDRTLAEDLLADTFERALENIGRFRWQGKGVLPWLIRIAKNLCLDHLRKSGRVAGWPIELDQLVPDPRDVDGETLVAVGEITDLMRERIDVCLGEINPRYRKVLH